MRITDKESLKTALIQWFSREDDADFGDRVDTSIDLAHAEIIKRLRVRQMEKFLALTVDTGATSFPLPQDFEGLVYPPFIANVLGSPLTQVSFSELPNFDNLATDGDQTGGPPSVFAIHGEKLEFRPKARSSLTFILPYYRGILPLEVVDTNFLLEDCPNSYFFAAMHFLYRFMGEEGRAGPIDDEYMAFLKEISWADDFDLYSASPLVQTSLIIPNDRGALQTINAGVEPLLFQIGDGDELGGLGVSQMSFEGFSIRGTPDFVVPTESGPPLPTSTLSIVSSSGSPLSKKATPSYSLADSVIETLNAESFQIGLGAWSTPGVEAPDNPWTRTTLATPSGSTGPAGGADPGTRVPTSGNGYMHVEASNTGTNFSLESPQFDASVGVLTLTFDYHARFGSVGGITDGTLRVQGWNGTDWIGIGSPIIGSQQTSETEAYIASSSVGVFDSTGFSNPDFRMRFRFIRGDDPNFPNYDASVDNVTITGPAGAVVEPPPPDPTNFGFNTGLRRLHFAADGSGPKDGTIPNQQFTNLQQALDAVQAGDVLTLAGSTVTGSFNLTNAAGTVANPIWIVAEDRGGLIVSNYIQGVLNGTTTWTSDGSGIFSIAGSLPYIGHDRGTGEFLPVYKQVSDINATTLPTTTGPNSPSGSIVKPQSGFTASGGRIRLKLRDGGNPTGRNIALTNGFNRTQMTWNNADNVIMDGIQFEGAGDGAAMVINANCSNPEVRNCVFEGCQFGVRTSADNTLIKRDEYFMTGMELWQLELRGLNGQGTNAAFRYAKNYANAGNILGNGNFGDALHEGGLDTAEFNGEPADNVIVDEVYCHDCFEGSKAGRHRNAIVRNSVFSSCLDDGIEWETASSNTFGQFGTSECHDNLFRNCFVASSYQGNFTHNDHFFYRNICVIDNLNIVHPPFFLKMIFTPSDVDVQVYHNLFINPSANSDSNEGFGGVHWIWFGFSNSTAGRIRNFYNNTAAFIADLDLPNTGGTQRPAGRTNNVVVSPSDNSASAEVQGSSGGFFAGTTEGALLLNSDFTLQSGSPCRNRGKALIAGHPDTRASNVDTGPIPFGELPAHRVEGREFVTTLPDRWTSPGA